MNFLQPWVILATVVIVAITVSVVVLLLKFFTARKTGSVVPVAHTARLLRLKSYRQKIRRLWVTSAIVASVAVIAGGSAIIGTGRPINLNATNPDKYNRDIILCLDVSTSMLDTDEAILQRYIDMVQQFKGERIGLNVFNATSRQVFPLTDDYDYVTTQLQNTLSVFNDAYRSGESSNFLLSVTGDGTQASLVGDGLYGCTLGFDNIDDKTRGRSVVLSSDNMVNGKELVTLDEASAYAQEKNIRVYGLNPGSTTGYYVPDSAVSQMKEASQKTGGQTFLLSDASATGTIVDEISQLETSKTVGASVLLKNDNPVPYLYVAGIAFLAFCGLALWKKL